MQPRSQGSLLPALQSERERERPWKTLVTCLPGEKKPGLDFLKVVHMQPRTQACSRYPSDQRRLGTERDSARPGKKVPDQREKVPDNFSTKILCFLRKSWNILDV